MGEKIISICIPTYNRGYVLENTLEKLVKERAFLTREVEICVSDNASTDNTGEVVKRFADLYGNIIYHRNEINTGTIDGNFPIVAGLGSGAFIKFLNDYAFFQPGELDNILELVKKNKHTKRLLFFPNGRLESDKSNLIEIESLEQFVSKASYWVTWVLAAGFWREDLENINDRDRSVSKFMWCPDNYFRLLDTGRKALIYNSEFAKLQGLKSKGGYNIFYTFGINYLSMYQPYLIEGKITDKTYKKEKYRLFRHYLLPLYNQHVFNHDEKSFFQVSDAYKNLMVNYRFEPYFYIGLFFQKIKTKIKKLIK